MVIRADTAGITANKASLRWAQRFIRRDMLHSSRSFQSLVEEKHHDDFHDGEDDKTEPRSNVKYEKPLPQTPLLLKNSRAQTAPAPSTLAVEKKARREQQRTQQLQRQYQSDLYAYFEKNYSPFDSLLPVTTIWDFGEDDEDDVDRPSFCYHSADEESTTESHVSEKDFSRVEPKDRCTDSKSARKAARKDSNQPNVNKDLSPWKKRLRKWRIASLRRNHKVPDMLSSSSSLSSGSSLAGHYSGSSQSVQQRTGRDQELVSTKPNNGKRRETESGQRAATAKSSGVEKSTYSADTTVAAHNISKKDYPIRKIHNHEFVLHLGKRRTGSSDNLLGTTLEEIEEEKKKDKKATFGRVDRVGSSEEDLLAGLGFDSFVESDEESYSSETSIRFISRTNVGHDTTSTRYQPATFSFLRRRPPTPCTALSQISFLNPSLVEEEEDEEPTEEVREITTATSVMRDFCFFDPPAGGCHDSSNNVSVHGNSIVSSNDDSISNRRYRLPRPPPRPPLPNRSTSLKGSVKTITITAKKGKNCEGSETSTMTTQSSSSGTSSNSETVAGTTVTNTTKVTNCNSNNQYCIALERMAVSMMEALPAIGVLVDSSASCFPCDHNNNYSSKSNSDGGDKNNNNKNNNSKISENKNADNIYSFTTAAAKRPGYSINKSNLRGDEHSSSESPTTETSSDAW